MRYLLHHDIIQHYLNQDTSATQIIDLLLKRKTVYVSAHAVAHFAKDNKACMHTLMQQCRLAKTPSYIPTNALLNNTSDTISHYAAQCVDAWIVSNTLTGKHVINLTDLHDRLANESAAPIPFIDLKSQYHDLQSEVEQAIDETLNSGQFIMGDAITQFEHNLTQFCGAKHAIACGSGTDAILLALLAIDIQPDDEVILPCFSFIATGEIPELLKAKLQFVDIDASNYNIDVTQIEAKITHKTRVIMPVGLYGQTADMQAINDLAKRYSQRLGHKIYVIEDAAQSFGATYHGTHSCALSDMAATSFFPAKPLGAYGDAGAVFTNDDALADKIRSLLFHGQTARYYHEYIGINGRCDTLQAAMLDIKLKYFPDEIKRRQQIAKRYHEGLSGLDIILPQIATGCTSAWAQYSIRVKDRPTFQQYLQEYKIPTAVHYPKPLHCQPCFKDRYPDQQDFPIAEHVANDIVSLPMSPYLTQDAQDYIISIIKQMDK